MKGWRAIWFAAAAAVLISWGSAPSVAQMQRKGPNAAGPMYNVATEVTLKGSVESVQQMAGPQGWGGTHLSIKTDNETADVHLGPSWFLAQKKVSFAKGDQIEVTGSRVKFQGQDAIIAREIKKGNETITLRNARGIPMWSRGRQGGTS
jgi:DNA/RNA endonuclease YhcR with UshA esterase domain